MARLVLDESHGAGHRIAVIGERRRAGGAGIGKPCTWARQTATAAMSRVGLRASPAIASITKAPIGKAAEGGRTWCRRGVAAGGAREAGRLIGQVVTGGERELAEFRDARQPAVGAAQVIMAMGDAFLRQRPHIAGRNRGCRSARRPRAPAPGGWRHPPAPGYGGGAIACPRLYTIGSPDGTVRPAAAAGAALSVVIPTLNAAAGLPTTLACLNQRAAGDLALEVIVSDGGSRDDTRALAAAGAKVLDGPVGRGPQLAAGAAAAGHDWLLFLHADTWLARGWDVTAQVHMASVGGADRAGVFRFALNDRHPAARRLKNCRLAQRLAGPALWRPGFVDPPPAV